MKYTIYINSLLINHDIIMKWGAKGLAKKLNATLISA